jgi:branched-chain amino acid aminotransferase
MDIMPSINFLNYNSTLYPNEQTVLGLSNRQFCYGDGLFETIRCVNGQMPFLEDHWLRLQAGMQALKMPVPAHYTAAFFREEIAKILTVPHARIRLTVGRIDGGLYTPQSHEVFFTITAQSLTSPHFTTNEQGLKAVIYPEVLVNPTPYSAYKTNNALPYVLAAIFRQAQQVDESILLNIHGRVCEATSSSLFFVKGKEIYTPPLSEGCLAGIIRKYILEQAQQWGYSVVEKPILVAELPLFEAAFVSNTQQGVRWVTAICHSTQIVHFQAIPLVGQINASLNQLTNS